MIGCEQCRYFGYVWVIDKERRQQMIDENLKGGLSPPFDSRALVPIGTPIKKIPCKCVEERDGG